MNNVSGKVGVYRLADINPRYPLIPLGTEFCRLTVIENDLHIVQGKEGRLRRACRLRCSCEAATVVIRSYCTLKAGRDTSCGCLKRERRKALHFEMFPLIPLETQFDRWVVIENDRYVTSGTQTHRACLLRCPSCGTEVVRKYGALRFGYIPECPCRGKKERSIERCWRDLHRGMSRRGWDFHLTVSQLKAVAQLPCAYCGKEPSNVHRPKYIYKKTRQCDPSMEIRYSGLDRVDPKQGYIAGNFVPCCIECNVAKTDQSLENFFAHIDRIRSYGSSPASIHALASSLFDSSTVLS